MKLKGGDSNRKFQNKLFKIEANKKNNSECQNNEKNRTKFWSKQNQQFKTDNNSNLVNELNVAAIVTFSSFS
ncbi:MAG: hypothetical protein Q8M40_05055 [Legionella sp.]|nr:hypothetical protein [Legionella sp.]